MWNSYVETLQKERKKGLDLAQSELRDRFAIACLPTFLAMDWSSFPQKDLRSNEKFGEFIARQCYQYADYMMAERNK